MEILNTLIDEMILLPEDAEKMRNRGFSDEVIERKRWRSCHPDNERILIELRKHFKIEELLAAQLYVPSPRMSSEVIPQPQLLDPNILIPYCDKDGTVIKVRPHKLGFKGQGAIVYRTENSFKKSPQCVIAESEFKADAAEVFGYSSIGIPGIASMSGKNWDYFVSVLDDIDTDEFIICFDNEVKDNPAFKNFKPDWRKRYDTTVYAYAMAIKILEAGRSCRIAVLPSEWMHEGKIDIDGALSQKRSVTDMVHVIQDAYPAEKFLKNASIHEKHLPWVTRRIKQFFFKSPITIKNNCFCTKDTVNKDGEKTPGKRLTNCRIEIKNVYEDVGTENGIRRDMVITDEYGIQSPLIPLFSNDMTSKCSLNSWLMSKGNFLFYGTDKNVTDIWEYIFNHDESNLVYRLDRCGWVDEHKFWAFRNVIVKDGVSYHADENGICWVDNIGFSVNEPDVSTTVPFMQTSGKFDMPSFISWLSDTTDYEYPGQAKGLIAWMLSILFIRDIVSEYYMFPLLHFFGSRQGGKTTVLRWLMSFYGQEESIINLGSSSPVGITRALTYFSNLPIVVDDWRNDPKYKNFVPMFLGVYNRQSGIKGIKMKFGLMRYSINAALAIAGEEFIGDEGGDNGLATRCLNFYMPSERRNERMDEIERILPLASSYIYDLLQDYDKHSKRVMTSIRNTVKVIQNKFPKVERRVLFNWSIITGVYNAILGEDTALNAFIERKIVESSREMVDGDKIHQFSKEFLFGVTEGLIQPHHFKYTNSGKFVYLYVKGICDVMNNYYKRRSDNTGILVKHLSIQPYFEKSVLARFVGSRGALPAIVLNVMNMPDTLKANFEGAYSDDPRNTFEVASEEVAV